MNNLNASTHNAGQNLPLTIRCRVCGKEEWVWQGYVRDKDGRWMSFCETCKCKWVVWAMTKGVKFGRHPNGIIFGIRDGYDACPSNKRDEIITLWNRFIKSKVWKKNCTQEVVQFT